MLFRKLLRTMKLYKAQFISMIIMTAIGVGVFVGFNMEWYTLKVNSDKAFEASGFSDFRIVSETGFSKDDLDKIKALDGVDAAALFLSVNTEVKGAGGDVLALAVTSDPTVSGIELIDGEEYGEKSGDGLWISDKYAAANGIKLGDRLTLGYKTIEITGKVKGLAKASEFLICIPDETQLMPDYNSYGFVYASPVLLKNAMGAEFYTQINAMSGLSKAEFTEKAEKALGKTLLVLSKDDTVSFSETNGEINEGKTMGSILPVLFLAIAVLTMVTTMHRLTASEKTQIGTLKALGFKDPKITLHYASFALVIGVVGSAAGIGLGYLLGWYIMNPDSAMGTYIDMSDWSLHTPLFCWLVLIGINLLLLFIGFLSVRSMLKGTAAEVLRPYSPKRVKRLLAERTKAWKRLRFGTKWNIRDTMRHKSRTAMTLFGIVGCMVLMVGGLGMQDTMDGFMDAFYYKSILYETRIYLDGEHATNDDAVRIAEKYDGDRCAQTSVQVGDEPIGLEVYGISHGLIKFPDLDMKLCDLSDDGAYICERLSEKTGAGVGDKLKFSPYGSDKEYEVTVEGVMRSMSESIMMTEKYADRIGWEYRTNLVLTKEKNVAADELILNTQSKQNIIDSFDTFMDLMNTMVLLLVLAAAILGVVVLYNLGVMSYTERYREMATLKVVGFKDRAIGRLLISQNMWLTVAGVLIGIPCGVGVLQYLLTALASEYELKLLLGWKTYVISTALTFGVSLIVGLMISRKNKRIDMVEALKGTE